MWKSRHRHKKFYRITLNFRKLLQFFLETFQQLLEASEVEPFLSTLADIPGRFPQKCLEQVFCKANVRACASVKKDLHSWRYLRNFSEFQKCARLESVVFGMQFTKKELHYRLQCRHLRKLFGVNIANCRFLEISRRTTFWNTPGQVKGFLTELYNVEISPITLLRSDSSREAILAILKNRKIHRKYFPGSQFSV